MSNIAILYYSGYGHTHHLATTLADAVNSPQTNAQQANAQLIRINDDGEITPKQWETLLNADAIIYGSPTYMGAPAWQFKKVADASSKPWFELTWKDKIAGGFTVSAATNGDKASTINYFMTLSQQHGQIWVGTGLHPAGKLEHTSADINWSGSFAGIMAIARADAEPEGIYQGDIEMAKAYAERLVTITQRLNLAETN